MNRKVIDVMGKSMENELIGLKKVQGTGEVNKKEIHLPQTTALRDHFLKKKTLSCNYFILCIEMHIAYLRWINLHHLQRRGPSDVVLLLFPLRCGSRFLETGCG
mgnify:CR=1 FL=1